MRLDDGVLHLDKELSLLDEFVIDVTSILDDLGVGYVVVSGYVAILTGRSRATGQYRDVSAYDDVPYTEVIQYRRHVDDELVEQGELLVQMEDPIVEAHRTRISRPHI